MKRRYYITPSRLDNMTVRKNGKVTRTLKGGELYTGIEVIKYNILHLLSPVDMRSRTLLQWMEEGTRN